MSGKKDGEKKSNNNRNRQDRKPQRRRPPPQRSTDSEDNASGNEDYGPDFWNYIPPKPTDEEIFWTISQGPNFRGYSDLPSELKGPGSHKYRPVEAFRDAGISDIVLQNLIKAKYTKPTPVQKNAIPVILDDRDLMSCAQTGSGKTGAYLLPIMSKLANMKELPMYNEVPSPLVLVLVPTTELARQVHIDAMRFSYKTNIRVVALYGGCSQDHQVDQLQNQCGCHLVVATPGRLIDLIKKREISLERVKYLVLDEADRMLVSDKKTGKNKKEVSKSGFFHDVEELVTLYDMPPKEDRQTLMFSATFPKKIQELAQDFLHQHLHLWIGKDEEGGTFRDIKQTILKVEGKDKKEKLVEILTAEEGKRNIVFVTTKIMARRLVKFLEKQDFSVAEIHSDRLQGERELSLREFRGLKGHQKTTVPIIIATAAASRGLDIESVEQVINFDLPDNSFVGIEEYIHKIGRTGRIGNKGRAVSFFDPQKDQPIARSLVKVLSDSQQEVPDWLEDIAMHALGTKIDADEKFVSRDIRTK